REVLRPLHFLRRVALGRLSSTSLPVSASFFRRQSSDCRLVVSGDPRSIGIHPWLFVYRGPVIVKVVPPVIRSSPVSIDALHFSLVVGVAKPRPSQELERNK